MPELAEKPAYVLAVLPQFPPLEVHKQWIPFVERLSKESGTDIRLKVYRTMAQFEDDIVNGVVDFAFLNPYQAVVARKAQGYIPLVKGEERLVGIIVVRKDSPINSIKDLKGGGVVFPAPNS